jgi:hypothetical protein
MRHRRHSPNRRRQRSTAGSKSRVKVDTYRAPPASRRYCPVRSSGDGFGCRSISALPPGPGLPSTIVGIHVDRWHEEVPQRVFSRSLDATPTIVYLSAQKPRRVETSVTTCWGFVNSPRSRPPLPSPGRARVSLVDVTNCRPPRVVRPYLEPAHESRIDDVVSARYLAV